MFTKLSRYRKLPDIVSLDAQGRRTESKSLRLFPEVSGTLQHTVDQGGRLDHLAFKYYKQPRKWWRICDANPEFMSPRNLLGKTPMVTADFPLRFTGEGDLPSLSILLSELLRLVGVQDGILMERTQLVQGQQTVNGQQTTVYVERVERSFRIIYNTLNISVETLNNRIQAAGFDVATPEPVGRVGKNIVIPPNVTT